VDLRFKNYIFDFDGTIANTLYTSLAVAKDINSRYKIIKGDLPSIEEIRNLSSRDLYAQLHLSKIQLFYFTFLFLNGLSKEIPNSEAVFDMKETLEYLKSAECVIGIVTSSRKKPVKKFLEKNNMPIFDFVDSSIHVFGKDKVLRRVLKKYNLNPLETVYIGDETRDIDAARKAGIHACSVTWGLNSEQVLKQSNPDFIISKPNELLML